MQLCRGARLDLVVLLNRSTSGAAHVWYVAQLPGRCAVIENMRGHVVVLCSTMISVEDTGYS